MEADATDGQRGQSGQCGRVFAFDEWIHPTQIGIVASFSRFDWPLALSGHRRTPIRLRANRCNGPKGMAVSPALAQTGKQLDELRFDEETVLQERATDRLVCYAVGRCWPL